MTVFAPADAGGSDLVVVQTFLRRFEAELAQSALEAAGIHALVRADDAGGLRPALLMGRPIELVVRAEDAAQARRILRAF
jgi:hypothetical protein